MEVMVGNDLPLPINDTWHQSTRGDCGNLLHLEFNGYIRCGVGHRLSYTPREINVTCPAVSLKNFEEILNLHIYY